MVLQPACVVRTWALLAGLQQYAAQTTEFSCGYHGLEGTTISNCERDAAILATKLDMDFNCGAQSQTGSTGTFLRTTIVCDTRGQSSYNSISCPDIGICGPMNTQHAALIGEGISLHCNGHYDDPGINSPGRFVILSSMADYLAGFGRENCEANLAALNSLTADACTTAADGNACQNGGDITGTASNCGCSCADGYSGGNCETADSCITGFGGNPCENGGATTGTTGN